MKEHRVSPHEMRVRKALSRKQWKTSAAIAVEAAVAGRTARAHLSRLVAAGEVEERRVFPAFEYRLVRGAR
jgi:predicted ArsR family transcriptional regulator